ncbi:VOC family protein [Dactylosporangium sp. NPDC048998]|uniref:VOC family protein n=1 Tax=Dactylosporangium sp. NPDC048998 TaxID=3363976 RepID=UPI00371BA863
MIARLSTVVLDTPDPHTLARFYAELLGLQITKVESDWIDVGDESGRVVSFQLAPNHIPPQWPDPNYPQQLHLDIWVDDIDAAEAKALRMGAQLLATTEAGFRVYSDPAGHPFCLEHD